jgi:hypothetical protein
MTRLSGRFAHLGDRGRVVDPIGERANLLFVKTPPALDDLIREARERSRAMTSRDFEEQARNFAAGNVGLEDPRVTREVVDRAVARRTTYRKPR